MELKRLKRWKLLKKGNEWEYISKAKGNKFYMEKVDDHFIISDENKIIIQDIDSSNDFIETKDSKSFRIPFSLGEKRYILKKAQL